MRTKKQIVKDYRDFLESKGTNTKVFSDEEIFSTLIEVLYDTEMVDGNLVSSRKAWFHFVNFIIRYYVGTEDLLWNSFVKELFEAIEHHSLTAIMASRGFGKSSILFIFYPIFKMFLYEGTDVLLCANIPRTANRNFRKFKRFIEGNEILKSKIDKEKNYYSKWGEGNAEYNGGLIETISVGSSGRGAHVPIIILDDPLRDDNKVSPNQIREFVLGQLYPAVAGTNGRLVVSGTPISEQDILHEIMNEKDDYQGKLITDGRLSAKGFYSKVFPAVKDYVTKEVGLPERYTWDKLMMIRKTVGEIRFAREYLCLKGDTKIKTRGGFKNIEFIKKGDEVVSHVGKLRKVTKTLKREISEQVVNIQTFGNYRELVLTKEHPVLVNRDDEFGWVEADKINNTDYLVDVDYLKEKIPGNIDLKQFIDDDYDCVNFNDKDYIQPKPSGNVSQFNKKHSSAINRYVEFNEELCELFGWWIAEGSIGAKQKALTFSLSVKETNHISRIMYLLKKIFGRNAVKYTSRSVINIKFHHKCVTKLFVYYCGKLSHEKKFNEIFFGVPFGMRKALIKSYVNGDGHINREKKIVRFTTVSPWLAYDFRRLFTSLGIPSTITKYKPKNKTVIEGRTVYQKPFHAVTLTGSSYVKFMNVIFEEAVSKSFPTYIKSYGDLCLYKVKSKSYQDYSGFVYNISVDTDESYVTELGITHNCRCLTDETSIFPESLLRKCIDNRLNWMTHGEKNKVYVIGVDLAASASKRADFTSFVVIEYDPDTKVKIVREVINAKFTAEEQEKELINLASKFNNAFVYIEKNNMGEFMRQKLIEENVNVEGFTTNRTSKQSFIRFLRTEFANKRIFFPTLEEQYEVVKTQLLSFGYKERRGIAIMEALSGHDDIVDALAAANMATQLFERQDSYAMLI